MTTSRTQLFQATPLSYDGAAVAAELVALADAGTRPGEYIHAVTFTPSSSNFSDMLVVVYHHDA